MPDADDPSVLKPREENASENVEGGLKGEQKRRVSPASKKVERSGEAESSHCWVFCTPIKKQHGQNRADRG